MRSILIAARKTRWRAQLTKQLEREGYVVVNARGRDDALDVLDAFVPAVLLVDTTMSREEGHRLLAEVAARPHLEKTVRLVVVKDLAQVHDKCGDVFVAPVDPGHVSRALRTLYPCSAAKPPEGGWPTPARDWSQQIAEALES